MQRSNELLNEDDRDDAWDLDKLLRPAQAFEHPSDVVNDADLTLNEKRAILASWASDACAVEVVPSLRCHRKESVLSPSMRLWMHCWPSTRRSERKAVRPHTAIW